MKHDETKLNKVLNKVIIGLTVIILFAGLLDLIEAFSFYPIKGLFVFLSFALILSGIVWLINKSYPKKFFRFLVVAIAVAAMLEVTVFQFTSYESFLNNDTRSSITASQAAETGSNVVKNADGTVSVTGNNEALFNIQNINTTVGTIYIDTEFSDKTDYTLVNVSAVDECCSNLRQIGTAEMTSYNKSSQYIRMHLNGKVSSVKLSLKNADADDAITVKSIAFNLSKPFNIVYPRFLIIVMFAALGYALLRSATFKKPYKSVNGIYRKSAVALMLISVLFMVGVTAYKMPEGGLQKELMSTEGNQLTKELVDAFEKGQVNLTFEPSETLKNAQNPYDRSQRTSAEEVGTEYWDHLYYNGKMYSYYGTAPVLLLFLPYHLITGYYFPTDIAVLLFSVIGIIFLYRLYAELIQRFFDRLPANIALAGLVVLLSCCGVYYLVGRPMFYEISLSCGFMFLTLGAYLLLSSNILGDEKLKRLRIVFASLCFGLAVLSRPTLAVYAFCAALLFAYKIFKQFKSKNPKSGALLMLCAFLPLGVCAAYQMWYNFARFGSPFDFGISYSITITDFVHNSFYPILVAVTLCGFLFAAPIISPSYPYISTQIDTLGANGFYFVDDCPSSGLVSLALPVLGYLFSHRALRYLDKKQRIKYLLLVGLPCVVMPLVIICSSWESGYAVRYMSDFAWQMLLGALVVLYFLYLKSSNVTKKRLLVFFFAFSAIAAVVMNGIQIYNFIFPQTSYPAAACLLKSIISG